MDNMPIAAMEDRILPGSAGPNSVLVAPDSFKGTYSAAEVARAIGLGLMQSGFVVDFCPVADGGEGTMAALAPALGAVEQFAQAADPLGMPIEDTWTIQPELSFGLTVFLLQSMRPGKEATTPLPSETACELNPLSPSEVNR